MRVRAREGVKLPVPAQPPPLECTRGRMRVPSLRAVVAQWIRPRTSNGKVPGSNLLTAAVGSLGNVLYHHCLVPRKVLKVAGPPGSGNLLICNLVAR